MNDVENTFRLPCSVAHKVSTQGALGICRYPQ